MNAQTNTPNPNVQPALFKNLSEDIDVSRYQPRKAGAATRERLLARHKQMNSALPK
ncbi:MAG TPA: hypothetical protein VGF13_02960 [Verrucomicrobiae bacterium]